MPRISDDQLQELKDRVNLVDVIRPAVGKIVKKGQGYWACCPFHGEKTPSFQIREDLGFYHCFGCGAHGDAIKFVMEKRGGDFMEAVQFLADGIGMQLNLQAANPEQDKKRQDGFAALTAANIHFQQNLKPATDYIQKRGLTDETIQTFELGYATDAWDGLRTPLTAQGFSPQILLDAGLTVQSDKGREDYDRFRGRLMFPIHDLRNRVVGFGGRVLGDGEPKYLNSSETPFFHKSRVLYNLNRAREHMRTQQQALLVEGYMDVIGLWQHGIKTAVAACGTAVTPEQLQLLWKYHNSPTVCLDGDTAGRRAALRTAERALSVMQAGQALKFVFLPQGEDPDSLVAKQGKTAFQKLINHAQPLEAVLWQAVSSGLKLTEATGKSTAEKRIDELLKTCADANLAKHLRQSLRDALWQAGRSNAKPTKAKQPIIPTSQVNPADIILGVAAQKSEWVTEVLEKFAVLSYTDPAARALHQTVLKFSLEKPLEPEALHSHIHESGLSEEAAVLSALPAVQKIVEADDGHEIWLQLCADVSARLQQQQQRQQQLAQLQKELNKKELASTDRR